MNCVASKIIIKCHDITCEPRIMHDTAFPSNLYNFRIWKTKKYQKNIDQMNNAN